MDLTGRVVGRYRIGQPIGVGGFATVYRAVDERFESPVAVKVLAENHALTVEIRERFLAEAQIQRGLSGTGVVAVHDLGETESRQPYTVMALAEGGDFASRVDAFRAQGGRADTATTVRVAEALARPLTALHAKGIVHRDIKPDNLLIFGTATGAGSGSGSGSGSGDLLGEAESLLLADLGFAKQLGAVSGVTVGGGTPGFRPPEQEQVGVVDYRADVFGASALLFWLWTGSAPSSDVDEAGAALDAAGAPRQLIDVLLRGLSPDREERPGSIGQWLAGVRAAAGVSGSRSLWRKMVPVVAALAIGLLAGAAAVRFVGPDDGDRGAAVVANGDGTTTWSAETSDGSNAVSASVTGPATVAAGEPGEYSAVVQGAASTVWVGPDGVVYSGRERFVVTAAEPGRGRLTLIAFGADGDALPVEVLIEVTDGG